MEKMTMNIYNGKNEIVNTFESQLFIMAKLGEVYNSKHCKTNWVKKLENHYNYTNRQRVVAYLDKGYKYEFINVPCTASTILDWDTMTILAKEDK